MSIVHSRVFGDSSKPTIYYLTGYRNQVGMFHLHIRFLQLLGYRMMAFEYDSSILDAGKPELLTQSIHDIEAAIKKDLSKHEAAGLYGISLGSWLGVNVAALCGIKKAMLNSGTVNITNVIWHKEHLKEEKKTFINNGHTKESLGKAWGKYDITANGSRLKNIKLLIMNSNADQIMEYAEVAHNVSKWQQQGIDVRLITVRKLSHVLSVTRNLFRLYKTAKYFREG